jgi:hypothetical protein
MTSRVADATDPPLDSYENFLAAYDLLVDAPKTLPEVAQQLVGRSLVLPLDYRVGLDLPRSPSERAGAGLTSSAARVSMHV